MSGFYMRVPLRFNGLTPFKPISISIPNENVKNVNGIFLEIPGKTHPDFHC